MRIHFFIYLVSFFIFTGNNLQAQPANLKALQWLQQHQDALAYRVQSDEEEGYLQKSFRFLADKIVERAELYGDNGQLLSANEQDWLYNDFQPVIDFNSLIIDTLYNGKLCMVRLITLPTLMSVEGGIIGNALFELGYPTNDSVAKQMALHAVKAIMDLVVPEATQVSNTDDIRIDYMMLEATINQQKFLLPPKMRYSIHATLKDNYFLKISESRPDMYQSYTVCLKSILSINKIPDTTGNEKNAVHFILKMRDSVHIETTDGDNHTKYIQQKNVAFTLEGPSLIAKTEALLNNICRDNYRWQRLREARILEETY
jgi:hypothetical protein